MKTITAKSILIGAAVCSAVMAQAHVEKGSFLNKRAHSVQELVSYTEHDAQVRSRYERHFHMSEAELVDYFGHLHVGKLASTGDYVVYNCHDDEVIRARVFRLKAGTPMFVDSYNKPILKISCGNPMVAPTPKPYFAPKPHGHPVPHETPTPTPAPAPQVVVVPEAPAPAPCPPPVAPVESVVTTSTTTSKSLNSLFFLPIVAVFSYHSNHSSKVTVIKKTPTPEPASLLIMGFGATALVLRRKKRVS
jgi:hypothetical protein